MEYRTRKRPKHSQPSALDKDAKSICWRREVFNKGYRENWISTLRGLKLEFCLSPYTNINSNVTLM
jgi:hypothetical protein